MLDAEQHTGWCNLATNYHTAITLVIVILGLVCEEENIGPVLYSESHATWQSSVSVAWQE